MWRSPSVGFSPKKSPVASVDQRENCSSPNQPIQSPETRAFVFNHSQRRSLPDVRRNLHLISKRDRRHGSGDKQPTFGRVAIVCARNDGSKISCGLRDRLITPANPYVAAPSPVECAPASLPTLPKLRSKVFILETPVDQDGDEQRNLDTLKILWRKSRTTITKSS